MQMWWITGDRFVDLCVCRNAATHRHTEAQANSMSMDQRAVCAPSGQ